ncbi:MAG: amidohydrolase family protein [Deltaproteobacteria bacterium]|nr:amidohydrolase family protein [Deltaproteobacteria bacterium]
MGKDDPRPEAEPNAGLLATPFPALNDPEGNRVPAGLPPIIDAHVHLFPDPLFRGIWDWFGQHGWPIRYQRPARELASFLLDRGVEQVVLLPYAHRPGVARDLNRFVASVCGTDRRMVGLATVLPGEPDARAILDEAFGLGLRGVKLHCHVQCFAPDAPSVEPVYEACAARGLPVVIHAGREPKSPAYRCDPHEICSAERVERVLRNFPELSLCVPHLGYDELDGYEALLTRYDNLWLDTSVALARYLSDALPDRLLRARPERVLYGSDFPNIPYAWDRELKHITELDLDETTLRALLADSARTLFGLDTLTATDDT